MKRLFVLQERLPEWRRHFVKTSWLFFVKKLKILRSSDHPIRFKFDHVD